MFKLKSVNLQVYIMLIAIAVIMVFFTVATDGAYLSARNISNLLRQTSITGILAIGMVFVIISAEIDLSVGSLMGLLGGFAAISDVWWGLPLPFTIVATLALGLLFGLWNGWWVAYRKVPSFIVTLAGYLAFRGILIGLTNGTTVSPISSSMSVIGQGYLSDVTGFILGSIAVDIINVKAANNFNLKYLNCQNILQNMPYLQLLYWGQCIYLMITVVFHSLYWYWQFLQYLECFYLVKHHLAVMSMLLVAISMLQNYQALM